MLVASGERYRCLMREMWRQRAEAVQQEERRDVRRIAVPAHPRVTASSRSGTQRLRRHPGASGALNDENLTTDRPAA